MAEGLLWYDNGVLETAQKFSVAAAGLLDDAVVAVVETNVELTVAEMKQIVLDGGVNQTAKGGPRVRSGAMLASAAGHVLKNGRGRTAAEVGFLNAPRYTPYQELGTTRGGESEGGIPSMLAFATAQVGLVERMVGTFESGKWLPRIF